MLEPTLSSAYRKPHTCWQPRATLTGGVAYSERARATPRRTRRIRAAGLVVIATIAAALGHELQASSSSTVSSSTMVLPSATVPSSSTAAPPIGAPRSELPDLRSEHRGPLREDDGAVPDGTTVFDDGVPGVVNLDAALLGALRQAATHAAYDGVEFFVDSGWRSAEYQKRLLQEAILKYGSREEAVDGWPPPTRLLTCRARRSTLGAPMPQRGCPSTARSTGCARSTATNPGTTNFAVKPSITVARPCTPTLRTTQGRSSDQPRPGKNSLQCLRARAREDEATQFGRPSLSHLEFENRRPHRRTAAPQARACGVHRLRLPFARPLSVRQPRRPCGPLRVGSPAIGSAIGRRADRVVRSGGRS